MDAFFSSSSPQNFSEDVFESPSEGMSVLYPFLVPVAWVSTTLILLISPFFSHAPALINLVFATVILLAFIAYSILLAIPLIALPAHLAAIVFAPKHIPISRRQLLLLLWSGMLGVSVAFALFVSRRGSSNSLLRKFFHLTLSIVFLSGLLLDPWFLHLSSCLLFSIFSLIELLRFYNVPPWGDHLNKHLLVFRDHQDGSLLLTPLLLLCGVSLPLVVSSPSLPPSLPHLAGLLAVGVGDSAAAVAGTLYGRHPWPTGGKTVEGTAAFFISVAVATLLLQPLCGGPLLQPAALLLSAAVLAAAETLLPYGDNFFLPLIGFTLFSLFSG